MKGPHFTIRGAQPPFMAGMFRYNTSAAKEDSGEYCNRQGQLRV